MRRAALMLPLLVLAACPPSVELPQDADAGPPLFQCASRQECEGGRICSPNNVCERCTSDGQCDLRELCDPKDQVCVFKPDWGRTCERNPDCSAGRMCVQGLCRLEQEVTLCQGTRCLADGQRCNQANLVCEEDIGCLADGDCLQEELCNVPTNSCVLRCTPERQSELCAAGQKCVDSRCTDCADNADCPGGLVCDIGRLKCVSDGSARCATNRDCEVGLVCNAATGFCTAKPPPCRSDDDCLDDERCNVPSGKCLRRACQPDRYEPNDEVDSATTLVPGTFPDLTLCGGEQDWFKLTLNRGDHLDVFIDADPLMEDAMDARLLDDSGRSIARGSLAMDRTVARDGNYFVMVQSTDAFALYGLRISVSRGTPCDDDRFEPNDELARATPLAAAGEYDRLTMCPQDVDFFRLAVPAGKGVKVELNSVPTEGDLDLFVLTANGGTVLGKSQTGAAVETVQVNAAAIQNGEVVLKVSTTDPRTRNEYFLRITYIP